jgi:hypothetical protein
MSAEGEIIDSIQKLQDVEQRLFSSLTSGTASGLSADQQNAMITEINDVAQSRTSLYSALLQYYKGQQGGATDVRQNLVDQKTVLGLFENQLNHAKGNYNRLKSQAANKLRMVEINTYYGEKYKAYGGLMKIVLLVCAPVLILAVLSRLGLFPRMLAGALSFVAVAVGGFFIVRSLIDIYARDNMVFNEYNWEFDPTKAGLSEHVSAGAPTSTFGLKTDVDALGCIDSECCTDGSTWDKKTGRCVAGAPVAKAVTVSVTTPKTVTIAPPPQGALTSVSTIGATPSKNGSAAAAPKSLAVVGTGLPTPAAGS